MSQCEFHTHPTAPFSSSARASPGQFVSIPVTPPTPFPPLRLSTLPPPPPSSPSPEPSSSATVEEVRGLRPALVLQDLFKRYAPRSSFFSLFSLRGASTGRRSSRTRRGLGRSGSTGGLGESGEAGATVGLHPLSITLYEGQTFAFLVRHARVCVHMMPHCVAQMVRTVCSALLSAC